LSGVCFADQKTATSAKRVNINSAGIKQLVTLPRIGEKIAQRIIDFRKKHGKFKRVQDLMKVKGIGEKTFAKLKERITV
jgi:competence protein ComEA